MPDLKPSIQEIANGALDDDKAIGELSVHLAEIALTIDLLFVHPILTSSPSVGNRDCEVKLFFSGRETPVVIIRFDPAKRLCSVCHQPDEKVGARHSWLSWSQALEFISAHLFETVTSRIRELEDAIPVAMRSVATFQRIWAMSPKAPSTLRPDGE